MKKFFLIVFFLFLAIGGGLTFFIIRSFNTEAFQKQIINNITEMTGREFNVMGATYVTWFPTPQIVMNDISLANVKGEERAVMLRANRIGVELEWSSLLKILNQPLVIKKVDVENPSLYLERIDATHVNWNFPFLSKVQDDFETLSPGEQITRTRIDAVSIRNGVMEYTNNVDKTKWTLNNINGNLVIETLQGPYTYNGTFKVKDKTMSAQLTVKELRNDSPVPFTLDLMGENNDFSLETTGTITPSVKNSMQLTANSSFNVNKPNDILKLFGFNPLSQQLNIPSIGNLTYETANGVDSFKSFTIRFGHAENAVAVTGSLGRNKDDKRSYIASFAVNKLDYAQWESFLSELNYQNLTDSKKPNFDLKLNVNEFVFGQNKFQNVVIDFKKQGDKFKIQNGKALLAGKTNITLSGSSVSQNNEAGFFVDFVGKSEQFPDFLKQFDTHSLWKDVTEKNASFKGEATLYPGRLSVDINELVIGKTKVKGTINYKKTEALPLIQTKLDIENIDLDKYFAQEDLSDSTAKSPAQNKQQPQPEKTVDITDLPLLIKNYFNRMALLKEFTGTFDITLKNAIIHNIPLGTAKITGSMEENTLKIKSFEAKDLANAAVSAAGQITQVGTPQSLLDNFTVQFSTSQFGLFMDKVKLSTDYKILKKIKNINARLVLSEKDKAWDVDIDSKMDELSFKLKGLIETGQEIPVYKNMQVSVEYPDFRKFSKNIYAVMQGDTGLNGELSVQTTLNGTPNDIAFSNGTFKVGSSQVAISGKYLTGNSAGLILNIEAPSFDMNKFIWSDFKGIRWNGANAQKAFNFNLFNQMNAQIQLKTAQLLYDHHELKEAALHVNIQGASKTIDIKELTGKLGAGNADVKVFGTIDWQSAPAVKLNIDVKNAELADNLLTLPNMSYGAGMLTFKAQLETEGNTPAVMLSKLSGKGSFEATNTVWVGTTLDKIAPLIKRTLDNRVPKNLFDKEMNRLLNSGKTTIEKISGSFTVKDGQFKALNTDLNSANFKSNPMSIQWNISGDSYDISIPLTLTDYSDLPPFALSVKGPERKLSYQTNFVDLSASVADLVKQDNSRIAKIEEDKKNEEIKIAHNEREEKIRQAISDAREAVRQATEKVKPGDNKKALYLLQSAQDAIEFINNMSIKETLTDAEYIQLTEQSRLAVMKSEEAVAEATNDKFFEDRKKLYAFAKSALEMQSEISRIRQTYPDIEIVAQLEPLTGKYTQALQQQIKEVHQNETDEDHYAHMKSARTAYMKVVKGYQYVLRFDADNDKQIIPLSLSVPQNKAPEMFAKNRNEDTAETPNKTPVETSETQSPAVVEVAPETDNKPTLLIKPKISGSISISTDTDENQEAEEYDYDSYSEPIMDKPIRQRISRSNAFFSNASSDVNTVSDNTAEIGDAPIGLADYVPQEKSSLLRGSINRAQ